MQWRNPWKERGEGDKEIGRRQGDGEDTTEKRMRRRLERMWQDDEGMERAPTA